MSSKSAKIAALIADCAYDKRYDPHYSGYFKCFNQQLYYEAHDVLEELWLGERGTPQAAFYQGLIQFAGAFVHLQKKRLAPASRLFALALRKLEPYPSRHSGLDLKTVRKLCEEYHDVLRQSHYQTNPWSSEHAPQLVI